MDKEERARKRVTLFRSLFRGREDAHARRWENDDRRSGYVPAAIKDWKTINKSRPEERKKVDQETRKFLPLTDAVIENHLLGKETFGVYPLLPDETCWFLAADFDKKTWEYAGRRAGAIIAARLVMKLSVRGKRHWRGSALTAHYSRNRKACRMPRRSIILSSTARG